MQRKFLGNLLFIILLNLIIKPFYIFGIDVKVQNMVGSEEYGIYFALLNLSFLFNIFLDVGLTNYNARNTAQHPNALLNHLGSFFGLKLFLSIPYLILTVGFALIVGYKDFELKLLWFFVINQILSGLTLYMRSNFQGLHLFKIDAFLSILDRLFLIVIAGILLYGNVTGSTFKIEWFIYAQTVSYGMTAGVALILTRLKIGSFKLKLRKTFSLAILKRSFPFALLILLMMLYTRIDSIMIERILPNGKEQAGVYAQVFRLLDAVNMFAFLVAGLLLPIFSRMIIEKTSIKPILQIASKLLIGVSIVTAVGLAINSEFTMRSIYEHNIESSSRAFVWLILSFIPISVSHIFSTLLTANHSLKQLNFLAIGGIIMNISLNLVFIPKMEAEGAAIATLITQTSVSMIQILITMKAFKLKINWRIVNQLLTLTIIFYFVAWFLMDRMSTIWSFLGTFMIGLVLLMSLKLINMREVLDLVKTKNESHNE